MTQGYIAIGYMCNQKCSFCPCSKEEKKYPIPSLEELKQTIETMITESGMDSIVVSGGEPTIHPEFCEFIKFLCEKKLNVTVLSNSEKFSQTDFLNKFLIMADPRYVEIITTIHSQVAVAHERVNGSAGSFERSIQGLRCLQSNGFHVTVKHCITKENYKDLFDFYNFVENTFPQDVDMQICSIDYCGLADDTKYDYMVVFPDLEPYFEKMFDQYMEDIDSGSVRHLYCINMPLCSMDPYYWDFVAPKAKTYGKYAAPTSTGESDVMAGEESFLGTFGKACERCKVEMICAGTYRTAFNYFGDKIIKPYE